MIAYNTEWLDNNKVQEQLEETLNNNCITGEEMNAAATQYKTGFYTPNIFIRIGLHILTAVIIAFSCGLFGLVFLSSSSEATFSILLIFFGIVCYAMLEVMVRTKNHYCSGVDDALLLYAAVFIISGMNVFGNMPAFGNAFLIMIFALYGFIRFTDRLMAFITVVALLAFVFFILAEIGGIAKAIAPFVLMLVSAAVYFISNLLTSKHECRYHHSCLTVCKVTALVSFYFSGNYFVVREASNVFFDLQLKPTDSIPFAWLFWLFTISVPLVYIAWGIIKKDIVLIRTGLLLSIFIVLTVRFYYAVLPAETAMILAGVILIVIAYALGKLLKPSRAGFTALQTAAHTDKTIIQNLEAIVIAETLSSGQPQQQNRFGGGNFGGGGAGGDF